MYLPRSTNNSKKDKTLYEVNEDHRFDALIKSSAYFSETEMEEIARALDDHEYETVNSFILQRAKAGSARKVAHFGSWPSMER